MLLEAVSDASAKDADERAVLVKILLVHAANIEPEAELKYTALHCASRGGRAEDSNTLTSDAADIEAISIHDYTPLHPARQKLSSCRANIEAIVSSSSTLLHQPVLRGLIEMVDILLAVVHLSMVTTFTDGRGCIKPQKVNLSKHRKCSIGRQRNESIETSRWLNYC